MNRFGYTLIELLVALAIIAALAAMIVTANPRMSKSASVEMAAEQVCAILRRARTTAIAEHSPTAVIFNIQSAPGSSGRVINNRSGGHWCRVLRSSRSPIGTNSGISTEIPPLLAYGEQDNPPGTTGFYKTWPYNVADGAISGNAHLYSTFARLAEEIRANWISERYVLPAGQVRFLALGDSDEGPRQRVHDEGGSLSGYGYGTSYPRPYFGWFDVGSGRLYPWGGYDPNLPPVASITGWPAVGTYSGLCYQGPAESVIVDSRNPADRFFSVDWNGDGSISGIDAERGPESAWYLRRAGTPRPLVDGEWGDFAIVFESDGSAWFPPMKCNRRWYPSSTGPADAKGWSTWTSGGKTYMAPNGESIHYSRHTSRAYITLAPDSVDDRDQFDSAAQALRTLLPMHRVYVSTRGAIGSVKVNHDENVLSASEGVGNTLWPSNPSIFTMATAADRTWIERNFRFGWPHEVSTDLYASYWSLRPLGKPISDRVSTEMMTRRIWWLLP
jgi:prepilin-type N-terminal cleavage/methylation domain-containing protein